MYKRHLGVAFIETILNTGSVGISHFFADFPNYLNISITC